MQQKSAKDVMKEVSSALKSTFPTPDENTKALWGSWWVIAKGDGWKLKYLVVLPKHRTSLQKHEHRNEIWIVQWGMGIAEVEGRKYGLQKQKVVGVQSEKLHRISNVTEDKPLLILELQYGDICEERDIVHKILGGRFK